MIIFNILTTLLVCYLTYKVHTLEFAIKRRDQFFQENDAIIHDISHKISMGDLDGADEAIDRLVFRLGSDHPDVIHVRTLLDFMWDYKKGS